MAKLDNISFSFPGHELFRDFSLEIPEGSISCVLGPSGCGKSTLLNLISQILNPSSGEITGFPESSFSFIFQETRILPWRTVYQNIAFPLLDKMDPTAVREKTDKFIDLVDLSDWRDQYPSRLSGGMKQRIAIARAFAFPSNTILMDEAFQGLDVALKNKVFEVFLRSWSEEPRTVIFVTHDLDEALYLGNQIQVLSHAPISSSSCFDLGGNPVQVDVSEEADNLSQPTRKYGIRELRPYILKTKICQ